MGVSQVNCIKMGTGPALGAAGLLRGSRCADTTVVVLVAAAVDERTRRRVFLTTSLGMGGRGSPGGRAQQHESAQRAW